MKSSDMMQQMYIEEEGASLDINKEGISVEGDDYVVITLGIAFLVVVLLLGRTLLRRKYPGLKR